MNTYPCIIPGREIYMSISAHVLRMHEYKELEKKRWTNETEKEAKVGLRFIPLHTFLEFCAAHF